jgi:hypothetical protein
VTDIGALLTITEGTSASITRPPQLSTLTLATPGMILGQRNASS